MLRHSLKKAAQEFLIFGLKQARACVFAGSFFVILALSKHIPLFGLARYDFLFLAAVLIQVLLVLTKIETKDEVKTIAVFHVIGFALEAFKTQPWIGSWSYPEAGFFKLFNVPLYSGFMYAAVGSYISQAWRIFKLKFEHFPPFKVTIPLALAIYTNFFTHHWIPDFRWPLIALVLIIFWKTTVQFTTLQTPRSMRLPVSFLLIAFFIWIAENIGSFYGAWQYPNQVHAFQLVSLGKISSWFLLIIISVILVADLKHFKSTRRD